MEEVDPNPFLDTQRALEAAQSAAALRQLFGSNFHQARVELGLSLEDVQTHTGVSQDDILEIESGRADPSFKTMIALARAVNRELSTLLMPSA